METATSPINTNQVAFDFCKNCIYYQCVNSELFSIKLFLPLPHSAPLPQGCFHSSSVVLSSLPQGHPATSGNWSRLFTALGLSLCLDSFAGMQIQTLPSLEGFPKAEKALKSSNAENNKKNKTISNLDLRFFCLKYQHCLNFNLQHVNEKLILLVEWLYCFIFFSFKLPCVPHLQEHFWDSWLLSHSGNPGN